jgi:response regulator RpfG family c-di-GMP phosphodiesterase
LTLAHDAHLDFVPFPPGAAVASKHGMRLKILLVDDDIMMLQALARALMGASLRFAMDTRSALEELQCEVTDIVMSDYDMPGDNGVVLLEAVRRMFPTARRVLMSASPPPNLAELCASGLVERFVPKPIRRGLGSELASLTFGPPPVTADQPPRPHLEPHELC